MGPPWSTTCISKSLRHRRSTYTQPTNNPQTARAREFKARRMPLRHHQHHFLQQHAQGHADSPVAIGPSVPLLDSAAAGGQHQQARAEWESPEQGAGLLYVNNGGASVLRSWKTEAGASCSFYPAPFPSFSSASSVDGSGSLGERRRARTMLSIWEGQGTGGEGAGSGPEAGPPAYQRPPSLDYVSTAPSYWLSAAISASAPPSEYGSLATSALAREQGTLLARQQAWLTVREQRLEAARAMRAQQEVAVSRFLHRLSLHHAERGLSCAPTYGPPLVLSHIPTR